METYKQEKRSGELPGWRDHLVRGLCFLLMLAGFLLLTLGPIWISNVPKYAILSVFGDEALGTVVDRRAVRYASFPYEGIVNTAEFRTAGGAVHQFAFTGEHLPNDSTAAFAVTFLPAWPELVLIDDEPRLSFVSFFFGALVAFVVLMSIALTLNLETSSNRFLRVLGRMGDRLIAFLPSLWDRMNIDP